VAVAIAKKPAGTPALPVRRCAPFRFEHPTFRGLFRSGGGIRRGRGTSMRPPNGGR
jgi:hypothetical protein